MTNKTEIRYWLVDGDEEADIVGLPTSKVPEVGEVISFGHRWDEDRANKVYDHLDEGQKKSFFPKQETLINGDYVVTSVKRYITSDYVKTKISEVFPGAIGFQNSTSPVIPEIPTLKTIEVFEVFIAPFKHSELTESPIAKVRNLLGPIVSHFEMLRIRAEENDFDFDEEVKQSMETLFQENTDLCHDTIKKLTKIIKDDKNWK